MVVADRVETRGVRRVKRYSLSDPSAMQQDEAGDWVRYEDVLEALGVRGIIMVMADRIEELAKERDAHRDGWEQATTAWETSIRKREEELP